MSARPTTTCLPLFARRAAPQVAAWTVQVDDAAADSLLREVGARRPSQPFLVAAVHPAAVCIAEVRELSKAGLGWALTLAPRAFLHSGKPSHGSFMKDEPLWPSAAGHSRAEWQHSGTPIQSAADEGQSTTGSTASA
mmetsp:Transcript_6087/g.25423  ORF Transcript_6087/g.25423 Transcript_6087/m.25423 type:complete len:137 (-) Transcript_6087:243-653(-)